MGCIKVAVTSIQDPGKLPFQIGILVAIYLCYSITISYRTKSQESTQRFKALLRQKKIGKAGDFSKLYLSFIGFFSSLGMFILFGITILLIAGDLLYPLIISIIFSLPIFFLLLKRATNETLAFLGFVILIVISYLTSTIVTQDIEVIVNTAIIFFIYRYFMFETLKMFRGYPRLLELMATLK